MITHANPPRTRRLAGVLLVGALVGTACGNGDDAATTSDSSITTEPASTAETPSTQTPTTTLTEAATTEAATTTAVPATEASTVAGLEAGDECAAVPTGTTQFALVAGGAEHEVRVYVPTNYDGSSELPLVMNFHGFGSTGDQQAAFTGYEELAEQEAFVVVHPTAAPSSTDEQGRNSWETPATDDPAKDDIEFANELLDLLIEDYCVDETRVYATGMSGGGLHQPARVRDVGSSCRRGRRGRHLFPGVV